MSVEISVVIPTFRRPAALRLVLEAYDRQAGAPSFEVVVVDDGSGDETPRLLAGWEPRHFPLRWETQGNAGPAAARNRALRLATGRWILFTGDDIEPAPTLLREHAAGHAEAKSPLVAILGLVEWPPGAEVTATMVHVTGPGAEQFSYHYFVDGREYDYRHFYTSNVSIARSLLDAEPSGFCTDFPGAAFEDAELAWRLARHGMRIIYRKAARGFHHHPYTARDFYRRQVRCGEAAALAARRVPDLVDELDLEAPARAWHRLRRTRRLRRVLEDFEELVTGLLERADEIDRSGGSPNPAEHRFLAGLFRFAFLQGLTRATLPSEQVPLVEARLLDETCLRRPRSRASVRLRSAARLILRPFASSWRAFSS